MVSTITPNRVVLFAVGAFIAYWLAALFVPPLILRDVFNSLAFGSSIIITITWMPSALRAIRENADSGEWQLILAIFLVWFVVMWQRIYVIAFNWYDRPEAWANSAVAGFWPYSYLIAGLLFLAAPGVKSDGLQSRAMWAIIAAVALGSFVAGVLFWASISTA
ncbi:hypothetical protein [Mesorhizobium sp. M2A.F.Ca.ET.039.01.1.1]|uniref:hypothetical protein n=1 Tax=Mesorhizobium sp. M2A.F.Ca.ET.039.01.1.1 TaxID=2496746 RepID=UPI000FCA6A58|nr:hypothetical protein [Mesorhizobium sp. M2A.F.Ca.ET.039.01.1.1]RWX72617.1 hypothetical protein EOA24_00085 [Mesorhizobium sp. M2A.F.Ca.ET.039.01.1.1]